MTKTPPQQPHIFIPPPGPARALVLWRLIHERAAELYLTMLAPLTIEAVKEASGVHNQPNHFYEALLEVPRSKIDEQQQDFAEDREFTTAVLQELEGQTVDCIPYLAELIAIKCAQSVVDGNPLAAKVNLSATTAKDYGEHTALVHCATAVAKLTIDHLSKIIALHGDGHQLSVAIKKAHEPTPTSESATVLRLPTRGAKTQHHRASPSHAPK